MMKLTGNEREEAIYAILDELAAIVDDMGPLITGASRMDLLLIRIVALNIEAAYRALLKMEFVGDARPRLVSVPKEE